MPRLLVWGAVIGVALLALDRLLLWLESRGWLYYRRNKPRGGAAVYHLMEMHSNFDPGIQEVMGIKVHEEKREDEAGDPLGPGHGEGPTT
jgi:hypothetical protein